MFSQTQPLIPRISQNSFVESVAGFFKSRSRRSPLPKQDEGAIVARLARSKPNQIFGYAIGDLLDGRGYPAIERRSEPALSIEFLHQVGSFGHAVRVQHQEIAGLEARFSFVKACV